MKARRGFGFKTKAGIELYHGICLKIPGLNQPLEKLLRQAFSYRLRLWYHDRRPYCVGAALTTNLVVPNLLGYFRTYEPKNPSASQEEVRGYHKPICLAGASWGIFVVQHVEKKKLK